MKSFHWIRLVLVWYSSVSNTDDLLFGNGWTGHILTMDKSNETNGSLISSE